MFPNENWRILSSRNTGHELDYVLTPVFDSDTLQLYYGLCGLGFYRVLSENMF